MIFCKEQLQKRSRRITAVTGNELGRRGRDPEIINDYMQESNYFPHFALKQMLETRVILQSGHCVVCCCDFTGKSEQMRKLWRYSNYHLS